MLSTLGILSLYFLSGFAALVYQVVWRRLSGLFVGMDVPSVTMVASVFMIGLGVGSLCGGYFSKSINKKLGCLYAFAAIEFFVATSGLLSKPVIYDFLYQSYFHHRLSPDQGFWVVLITTLIPTFFMGATLPLLSRAYAKTLKDAIGNISYLYCLNTLGAGLGAILTSTIFIANLGYGNTLLVAATANVICAIGALCLAQSTKEEPKDESVEAIIIQNDKNNFKFWCAIYALSGFTALGLEVIWFRILNVMLKANSMIFGSLLGLYLFGLAIGTFWGVKIFSRKAPSAKTFFLLQSAIPLYAVLSLVLLVNNLGSNPALNEFFDFFARYNPVYFDSEKLPATTFFNVFIFLPCVLIIPPTVLMGLSFSALQHLIQSQLANFEKRAGLLQASNIFGSGLGAVVVGMGLLEVFGTSGSLYFFLGIAIIFFCLSFRGIPNFIKQRKSQIALSAAALALILLFPYMPSQEKFWCRLHGHFKSENFIVYEDASGVAAYTPLPGTGKAYVYVNGQGHSELPFGGLHTVMGLMSAYLHPNPEDVAIIGLGSGDTFFSASSNRLTKSVTCFEILKPEWHCLWKWNELNSYAPLHNLANDRRLKIEFADARNAISNSQKKFDIIQGDPVRPFDAGAGFLNSLEFFQMLKERLKPGGMVFYWSSTARARTTFVNAFPYCVEFGAILVGSNSPIRYNKNEVLDSFKKNCLAHYIEPTEMNEEVLLNETLDTFNGKANPDPHVLGLNLDLHPRDEFYVPQTESESKVN